MTEVNTDIYSPLMKPTNPMEQTNNLLDTIGKAQAVKSQAIGIDQQKFDLAMKNIGAVNSTISGLLGDPDVGKADISKKIIDATTRLVKDNVYSAQHVTEALKSMPTDPSQQANWLRNIYSQTQSAEQRAQSFFGSPNVINSGSQQTITQVPGYPGLPVQQRGTYNNQLPPTTPQVQGDPSKPGYGQGGYVGPAGPPGIQPGPGSAPPSGFPSAPVPAPAARTAAPISALAPGQAEAANVAGGASGGALGDARNRSLNYQQEVNPLEQAIPALEKLGTKGTGPGTDSINHLKSFVLSNVPGADFKGLKDDVATYDKAKKYLTDFVNQNGNSGTNDKLAAAFAGSPSTTISNAAAVDVAKTALALRRFKQAQLVSFETSGKPDADFAKEAGKFAREHDPRAYGFDLMTPAQRKTTLESIPKNKRELFMMDVQDAVQQGILKTPQAK
jgi:hypothetical protein